MELCAALCTAMRMADGGDWSAIEHAVRGHAALARHLDSPVRKINLARGRLIERRA